MASLSIPPDVTVEDLLRRDLTINAMAKVAWRANRSLWWSARP